MDDLDKIKSLFIDEYETTLSIEGDEICKEVDSLLSDDFDLMTTKARAYCFFCTTVEKGISKELKEKCEKYLNHLRFYEDLKRLTL